MVGWIFGGLLTSFDPADSEKAHRKILERHFIVKSGALREEVEFLEFLARVRPNLPEALVPDFELARLRGIARALAHFGWPSSPFDAPWMVDPLAGVESEVVYFESADEWMLKPDAFWALQERYRTHPAAERLAWAAAQAPKVEEGCEGDPVCEIGSLAEDDFIRYLGLYPSGTHASEANKAVDEILTHFQEVLELNWDYHSSPEFIFQEDIHKAVRSGSGCVAADPERHRRCRSGAVK